MIRQEQPYVNYHYPSLNLITMKSYTRYIMTVILLAFLCLAAVVSAGAEENNHHLDHVGSRFCCCYERQTEPLADLESFHLDHPKDRLDLDRHDLKPTFVAVPRGGAGISSLIPAGYNPFGYQMTDLGTRFLEFEGSLDSDVGRFLASLKSRKRRAALKDQWLEIVRVSKSAQTMRIYRTLDDLIQFCIQARLLD
jgi:hypothetical protein